MKKHLATSVFIFLVFSNLRLILPVEAEENCANGVGFFCDQTCKIRGVCIDLGTGNIIWSPIEHCGEKFCDAESNSCNNNLNTCSVSSILCTDEGQVPNPYTCSSSVYCQPNKEPMVIACQYPKTSYNACTEKCEESPTENCPPVSPVCQTVGQFGVIKDNAKYFYMCADNGAGSVLPRMYKCDDDYLFSMSTFKCVYSENKCVLSSNTTPSANTTTTTTTTQRPVVCSNAGEHIPHPTDCTKFYWCDASLRPTVVTCTPGYHFDPLSLYCIYGPCN